MAKRTRIRASKKRGVVEVMFQSADRTALVTERMKELYRKGKAGVQRERERQKASASPESEAAETVQEEMERAPQAGARAVRQMGQIPKRVRKASQIPERVRRVREKRERTRWYEERSCGDLRAEVNYGPESGSGEKIRGGTRYVPSARAAGTSKPLPTGEQMRASALKQAERAAKRASATGGKAVSAGAGKSTVKTTKQAAARAKKAVVNSAKAVYQGIKSSSALIAAGGGAAVLVIVLICMVGMIFGSAFGIFFTGTQSGSSSQRTIRTVMSELDAEYDQTIISIQGSTEHDVLEFHGARSEWKEVLAVYAVKTNLDPNDSDELITMTKKKEKKLRDVFWDMVSVSSKVETEKRTVTTSVTDESGNVTEKKEEKEVTVLTIRTTSRSAREMAVEYGFGPEQEELLKELLDNSNDPLWAGVIY